MKIWEKIVEGVARLASAEPIGSLLGLASPPPDDGSHPGLRQIGFTIGVIALGAKMAGADGQVSDVEIEAFRNFFQVPPGEEKNVERFFDLAKRDVAGFETYARQLAALFPDAPDVLENVLEGLFDIARADGQVSAANASSAPGRPHWVSSSASPASFLASTRWRPTNRCARRGCARCAPIIPTG